MDRPQYLWGGVTPIRAIAEAFTIQYIQPLWFIWVIIAAYVVFYLVFKLTKLTTGVFLFAGITVIYILINTFVNPREEMYASIIGMPLGVIWAAYQDRINAFYQKHFLQKEAIVATTFLVLFGGRLLLSAKGLENRLIHAILRNLITMLFIVMIATLLQKMKVKNRVLMWLGAISYEIYIVHPFILYSIEKRMETGETVSDSLIVVSTVVLTLILASGLKSIQQYVMKKVKLI